jgi:hypothetical protein
VAGEVLAVVSFVGYARNFPQEGSEPLRRNRKQLSRAWRSEQRRWVVR